MTPKGGVAKVTCPTFEAMGQIPMFHRTYFLFTSDIGRSKMKSFNFHERVTDKIYTTFSQNDLDLAKASHPTFLDTPCLCVVFSRDS